MIYDVALVDGNNLAYRVFLTHKNLEYEDVPTGMIYGFLNNLISLKENWMKKDGKICVVWDRGHEYRSSIYPDYKASRKNRKMDDFDFEDFYRQKKELEAVFPQIGIYQAWKDGEEADDVIATLARRFTPSHKVLIYSNDHDLFQLLNDNVDILRKIDRKDILVTEESFIQEYGINPQQYKDVLSLSGDPGDDVPGVRGVGGKTALKIVTANPDLVSQIVNKSEISEINGVTKRISGLVLENLDIIRLSSSLVKIRDNISDIEIQEPQKDLQTVREKFEDWGFRQFLRIHLWEVIEGL